MSFEVHYTQNLFTFHATSQLTALTTTCVESRMDFNCYYKTFTRKIFISGILLIPITHLRHLKNQNTQTIFLKIVEKIVEKFSEKIVEKI